MADEADVLVCVEDDLQPTVVAALDGLSITTASPAALGSSCGSATRLLVVGLDCLDDVFRAPPAVPVLTVDAVADGVNLSQSLERGVQGYCSVDQGVAAIETAVQTVLNGHAYIPPALLGGLLHELVTANRSRVPVADSRFDRLSKREREVLDLLAAGKDQSGIARALVISPQTARTHIQNVLGKLEVHSRLEAVALAMEHRQVGGGGT